MDLIYYKSSILSLILCGSLAICFISLNFSQSHTSKSIASLGKTFSAGVFLGIAFLHLLPESSEKLSSIDYPVAGLVSIFSYFTMLLIEKVAFVDHSLVSHGKGHTDLGCHCESEHSDEEEDKLKHILSTRVRLYSHIEEGDGENCSTICKEPLKEPLLQGRKKASMTSSIILACALSVHSVIEGISLGIQSEYGSFINLSIAIIVHKLPESLIMGLTLGIGHSHLKNAMIIIYCSATPIGVIIGILINLDINPLLEGVFLSVCVGTFMYIAASEILVEEFAVPKMKLRKYFAAFIGFLSISLLVMIQEE